MKNRGAAWRPYEAWLKPLIDGLAGFRTTSD